MAVGSALGNSTERSENPRAHRQSRKCRIVTNIGKTEVEGIIDTGASGGNCLDYTVFSAIPSEKYHVISSSPSVCIGINRTPVRVIGKILLEFQVKQQNEFNGNVTFREEFNIIEQLVHPIVIGTVGLNWIWVQKNPQQ